MQRRCSSGHPLPWKWDPLGLVFVYLLVTACGLAGGGEPGAPAGFSRASTSLVSFAYPSGWERASMKEFPDGWVLAFEKRAHGESVAQVAVFANFPTMPDAATAAEAAIAKFQLTRNFQRTKDRAVKIPSASDAWRIDYTYNAESPQGGLSDQKVLGTNVTVTDEAGHAQLLRITRYPAAMTNRAVERIVDSVVVEPHD